MTNGRDVNEIHIYFYTLITIRQIISELVWSILLEQGHLVKMILCKLFFKLRWHLYSYMTTKLTKIALSIQEQINIGSDVCCSRRSKKLLLFCC